MHKLKIITISILSVLFAVGIFFIPYRREKVVIQQEVFVDDNMCVTSDGEYLYTNWDRSTKRRDTRVEQLPCMYFCPTEDGKFDIKKEEVISYSGSLRDASNYVALCMKNGYTVRNITADSTYIDAKLVGENCSIRVVYMESSGLRIMHEVGETPVIVAPFLM